MAETEYDLSELTVFDRRSIPYMKRPQASIQAGGAMSLNAAAHKALGEPAMVELLYGKGQNIIAIRPCDLDVVHAYPLRPQGPKAKTYMITARAFMLYNEIPCEKPVRYDLKIVDGMGIIDLNEAGYDASSNASRSRQKRRLEDPEVPKTGLPDSEEPG